MTFIVSLADDIEVATSASNGGRRRRFGTVIAGLHTRPELVVRGGLEEGVAVSLSPLGSRALLGVPAQGLAGVSEDVSDVLGRVVGEELRERIHGAAGWSARFAALDGILTRLLRPEATVARPLLAAWQLLEGSGGNAPSRDVAEGVGWSRRHLVERFTEEFGLPPKTVARLIRFGRVTDELRRGTHLATAAASCGYYDQSHMTHEFTGFADCSPGAWLEEEFSSLQDG